MHHPDPSLANSIPAQATTYLHGRYRNSATKWRNQTEIETQLGIEKECLDDLMAAQDLNKQDLKCCLHERKVDIDDVLTYMKSNRRSTEPKKVLSKLGESRSKLDSYIAFGLSAIETARAQRERINHARAERQRNQWAELKREQLDHVKVTITSESGNFHQSLAAGLVIAAGAVGTAYMFHVAQKRSRANS